MENKYSEELKVALENKNVVIGTNETIKKIKNENLKFIVISKNCPEETKKDLKHYDKLSKIDIQEFEGTSKDLGIFCGKPFSIAVIGVKK